MRLIRSAALAGAVALALSACGGGEDIEAEAPEPVAAEEAEFEAGSTMAELSEAGEMTIGTKFDQPGFGLRGLDETPDGFDVRIAQYIAAQLGIEADKIKWVESPSSQREDLIVNGDVDMVVATYTINDKRKERITFAGPYYVAGQQIMVKKDDSTISGPEDLKANPDVKICSVTGSTPAENIREYLASPDQLVTFEVYDDCVTQLENGQVQAVTTDNVILVGYVAENEGKFKLVGEQFTEEPYGIGIEKGDTAFCEFINESLEKAAEEGYYEEAWKETAGAYEGTEVPELPELEPCA
ncbi:glutamate transport system substrate-binding protein [Kineococcus xinjiangensis]|uniref:Glutamate transport system substrate-binding protein n=1 Tax=Kineococcus xinjiangensis TaxID=512762 RepID=A0A2S6IVY7_9ACTN|nr:glutamate ABC transporter substrate-binding protein [Kineococcus xinjiangensis]PPK98455.1 glutamate transport system substrate-binding protein [Kineococcus xinjiangensis]